MTVHPSAPGDLNWRWSRSCEGGACVMVARHGDFILFGNATEPNGPVYVYTVDEWRHFIAGAKAGDFDDLASLPVRQRVFLPYL
jgi:hypothetical protein